MRSFKPNTTRAGQSNGPIPPLQASRLQRFLVTSFLALMSMMPESPETSQIDIVVHGPDEKSDTCSTTSVRSAMRRISSVERTRLDPLLASSSSFPIPGGTSGVSPSEGTTLGSSSSSTRNTSRASLKSTDLGPAEPITASGVKRNDRGRSIPKPKKKKGIHIEPGKNDFNDTQRYDDWAPQVHPDGALYFFDSKRRIYTDADLSEEGDRRIINHYAEQLRQQAREKAGFPWDTCELVLEVIEKSGCGYYFVEPGKRCILWLTPVSSEIMTRDLERVQSLAHISRESLSTLAAVLTASQNMSWKLNIGELSFIWEVLILWSVTSEVVEELEQLVLHAVAESIASTSSVIPFDQEELSKMLELTDRLKDATKKPFPHANCIVAAARFMQDFAFAKFFNFCGQPGARLNSDQWIFRKHKPRHSLFLKILSFFLFWAPCDYAKELDGIWVDHVINRVLWKQFIAKLSNDWSSLALYATVVLNANVAFLALGDNTVTVAKSFSFVSTVTSVGVVVLGLILVRQNQRKDQDSAEQASEFLGNMSHEVFGTEILAVIFSLPYALLMWSMAFFVAAFATMVFGSAQLATRITFGVVGGFIGVFVFSTVWTTRVTEK